MSDEKKEIRKEEIQQLIRNPDALTAEMMKQFKLTSFDQYTGCPLITNDEEKVKALPYSPFKLYIQL